MYIACLVLFAQVSCNSNITPVAPTRTANLIETATLPTTAPTQSVRNRIYRGLDSYNEKHAFEVTFDEQIWAFVEKDEGGRDGVLQSREIKNCWIWLSAGPLGAELLHNISLASGEWKVSRVQPSILMYSQDYKNLAFIFGISLPKPYVQNELSACLQQSEDVLKTFRVVEKT